MNYDVKVAPFAPPESHYGNGVYKVNGKILRYQLDSFERMLAAETHFSRLMDFGINIPKHLLVQCSNSIEFASRHDGAMIVEFIEGKKFNLRDLEEIFSENPLDVLNEFDSLFTKLLNYYITISKENGELLDDIYDISQYIYNPKASSGNKMTLIDLSPFFSLASDIADSGVHRYDEDISQIARTIDSMFNQIIVILSFCKEYNMINILPITRRFILENQNLLWNVFPESVRATFPKSKVALFWKELAD